IRSRWTSPRTDLVFEVDQAYRFTRKITDAGAGITWSTTQKNGYMSADEMQIMLEIQRRIENDEEYMAYERPNGAYLLKQ
ncbi:hypothetical protein CWC06_20570, partial [Pseudoalteromonas ruthenica]